MNASTEKWWNALLLMRIPFSIFLMPIYWFALLTIQPDFVNAVLVFIILHFLVYPASNGYNSYFDRDEQSIGGLKTPPKVTRELWYVVIAFDILAIFSALFVNLVFAVMTAIYLLISKAYSYDKIRLKKYPIAGAITVVLFQGLFTYLAVQAGAGGSLVFTSKNILFGIVSSLFLLGSYPMTQIYQHEEDSRHGDLTLSRILGIHGTFIFTALVFLMATLVISILFFLEGELMNLIIYFAAMLPVNIYFIKWYFEFRKGRPVITFERTMMLNAMSSLLLSAAFITMLILKR